MISVVIPTHNRSGSLAKAIQSVLNQTYNNFEIIVVSDGSTDDTCEVIKSFTEIDSRIRFVHYNDSKGGNHARNVGIKESRGELIAFLDDDDVWLPNKLEEQLKVFLNDQKVGLVYSGINLIHNDLGMHYLSMPKEQGDLKKTILFGNCITTTSSVVVKKSVLNDIGGFDENLPALQDYDLWIRCLQITEVGFVEKPLVDYYISSSANQISSCTDKYVVAMEKIDEKYDALFSSLPEKERKKREASKYITIANIAFKNNNSKLCRAYCRKSIRSVFNLSAVKLLLASFLKYSFILKLLQWTRK